MFSLDALFCHVDDFCQQFVPQWQKTLLGHGLTHCQRAKSLCLSEIMTILIAFHANQYRNFKSYYLEQVTQQWGQAFPKLPSYQRFIEWIPSTLLPFCVYLKHCCGQCTGISFADSTALKVGHNRRISRHKVFKNLAQRGKTSVDWFFGFKLHLVVNERGELLNVILTTGNIDDRKQIPELLANIFGTVFAGRQRRTFGDWGYVSAKLATQLLYQFSKV